MTPIPRKRRLFYSILILLMILAITEGGAYLTYWVLFKERIDLLANASVRESIASNGAAAVERPAGPDEIQGGGRRLLHPYLGYVRRPNAVTDGPYYGVNLGLNPVHHRSPDKVIVAILGGSVAAGFRAERLPFLLDGLAASPRFAGKEFEVVLLANAGYKQPQHLFALEYVMALGGEFDMVINLDGFNEISLHHAENQRRGIAAIFPRNWYPWAVGVPDDQVLRQLGERIYLENQRARAARTFNRLPLTYSALGNLIWRLRDQSLEAQAIDAELAVLDLKTEEVPWQARGPYREYGSEAEMAQDLVEIWSRCSQLLDALCRSRNILYFHFLQPNQYVPGSKRLTASELDLAYRENSAYAVGAKAGYHLLIEEGRRLRESGVRYADMTQAFTDVENTLYVDTCCHFNDAGYRILGEAMALQILTMLSDDDNSRPSEDSVRE